MRQVTFRIYVVAAALLWLTQVTLGLLHTWHTLKGDQPSSRPVSGRLMGQGQDILLNGKLLIQI